MKISVLFVDDEKKVLMGLRRMLHSTRDKWECTFASSGREALKFLAMSKFDVVVSDMRMPNMDGAELLGKVKEQYPHTVRIVLSGQCDRVSSYDVVNSSHQFLSKPCDKEVVISTINRALALRDLLASEELQALVSGLPHVPCLPENYLELEKELRSDFSSVSRIADIISQDIGLTAKLLQMSNSAYFGIGRKVSSTKEAVKRIGTDTIHALVLSHGIFEQLKCDDETKEICGEMAQHGIDCGFLVKKIVYAEGLSSFDAESAFTAGLLHDVGSMVLAYNMPKEYAEARKLAEEKQIPIWQAEYKIFGTSHDVVGAYLAELWGMPTGIIEAIAFHHHPLECHQQEFNALTAVHVSEGLLDIQEADFDPEIYEKAMSFPYLEQLGLSDHLDKWIALIAPKDGDVEKRASL